MALIAIALGGVTAFFTYDSPERSVKKKIEQFLLYTEHAQDYTMVKDETWGIVFTPPQWREEPLEQGWLISWRRLQKDFDPSGTAVNQRWEKVAGLPDIDLPNALELTLFVDDLEWSWQKAPEEITPVVLFYASGEKTFFELELYLDDGFSEPVDSNPFEEKAALFESSYREYAR